MTTQIEAAAARWVASGLTDEVTDCQHCGRTNLKHTVRMRLLDADGNDEGEQYIDSPRWNRDAVALTHQHALQGIERERSELEEHSGCLGQALGIFHKL